MGVFTHTAIVYSYNFNVDSSSNILALKKFDGINFHIEISKFD